MKNKFIAPLALLSIVLFGCAPANKGEGKPTPSGDKFVSMSIHTYPKDEYEVGDYFDPTGLKLSVTTSTDVTMTIEYDDSDNKSFITFNPSLDTPLTLEHTKVVVTYEKLTADIAITVKEKKTEVETVSYTVDFNAYKFEGTSKEVSVTTNYADEEAETAARNKFKNAVSEYVTAQTKDENLFSDLSVDPYVGIKTIVFEGTDMAPLTTLQISGRNSEGNGEFDITLSKKIVSVKITAQAYFKAYEDHWSTDESIIVCSADDDTNISVNDVDWELTPAVYDEEIYVYSIPEISERTFEINDYHLSIKDTVEQGRFFIHKLELTCEA